MEAVALVWRKRSRYIRPFSYHTAINNTKRTATIRRLLNLLWLSKCCQEREGFAKLGSFGFLSSSIVQYRSNPVKSCLRLVLTRIWLLSDERQVAGESISVCTGFLLESCTKRGLGLIQIACRPTAIALGCTLHTSQIRLSRSCSVHHGRFGCFKRRSSVGNRRCGNSGSSGRRRRSRNCRARLEGVGRRSS
jgi:hypothetical protein